MDKDFFVTEMDAHSAMLYRVAYTILRNDDACRDALQETALKAWEKRFTLREPQYFRNKNSYEQCSRAYVGRLQSAVRGRYKRI